MTFSPLPNPRGKTAWVTYSSLVALAWAACSLRAEAANIPSTQVTALDGHTVSLPASLPAATVLIVGFTRKSADATTAWEKPTRTQLANGSAITFYDTAMIASVPRFARGFAIGRIRKAVPDVLKPHFLPLVDHEDEWKQAVSFDPGQEDAAYVVLVDHAGVVRWSTHEPFNAASFSQLTQAAAALESQLR